MPRRSAPMVLSAATAALALLLASCSGATSTSQGAGANATIPQLTVGDDGPTATLNPTKTTSLTSVYGAIEFLVKLDPNGRIAPDLAASVDRPDPRTYVYHLRQGVTFWDGAELTAADVVDSLDFERAPDSQIAAHFAPVKDISANGRDTVVITLNQPNAHWESDLATWGPIFEKKFRLAHAATYGQPGTLVMGTGPFKIDAFAPATSITMSANPHWWGGPVRIQRLTIKLFANETSEALAFRAGEIDVAHDVLNPRAFKSASGGSLVSTPAFSEGYFGMNVHQAPWNDVHVRRAVAYAINRSDVIGALGNKAEPVTTLIPPIQLAQVGSPAQVDALLKGLPSYPYDLAKARAELAKSAYPQGFSSDAITIDFGAYNPINEAIAGDLAKIGIKLNLKLVGFSQYLTELSGPRTLGGTYLTYNVVSPDPGSFPANLLGTKNVASGGWNYANYAPPALDAELQQGETTLDAGKRLAIYGDMLTTLATDVPYVPIFIQDYNIALSSRYAMPDYRVWDELSAWVLKITVK